MRAVVERGGKPWTFVLALVALLVLAGCGSDGSDDAADDTADSADSDDDAADSGGDAADGGDDTADGGGDDGAGDDTAGGGDDGGEDPVAPSFAEMFGGGSDGNLAVTYEGTDERGETFEMTLANQSPASVVLFAFDGVEGRLISPGDGTFVSCSELEGEWQCLSFGSPDAEASEEMFGAPVPFLLDQDGINAAVPGWFDESTAEIAGRPARCASTEIAFGSGGAQDGRSEVCVDAETGMVLRWYADFEDGTRSTVEATSVGEADPEWFVVPAEPMSLDDMMQGIGG